MQELVEAVEDREMRRHLQLRLIKIPKHFIVQELEAVEDGERRRDLQLRLIKITKQISEEKLTINQLGLSSSIYFVVKFSLYFSLS